MAIAISSLLGSYFTVLYYFHGSKNIIFCHIPNPKRLPTANIELRPMSEAVTTQQSFAPEVVQRIHLYIIFYIYYILII
jgi:hypothetical protein